jgi:hypothetical protein
MASSAQSGEHLADDSGSEDENIGKDFNGSLLRSIPNKFLLEFKQVVQPPNHRKEEAKKLLNAIVKKLLDEGLTHVPKDRKDLADGYKCLKLFVLEQQEIIKEGHANVARANTTLGFIHENNNASDRLATANDFKTYILETVFHNDNLKDIIATFTFVLTKLGEGVKHVSEHFRAGDNLKVTSNGDYGRHVKGMIDSSLQADPHIKQRFMQCISDRNWFKDLVAEQELLLLVYIRQCARRESITNSIRAEVILFLSHVPEATRDNTMLHMFRSAVVFGMPLKVQPQLLQHPFAKAFKLFNDKLPMDGNKKKKRKILATIAPGTTGVTYEVRKRLHGMSFFESLNCPLLSLCCISILRTLLKLWSKDYPPDTPSTREDNRVSKILELRLMALVNRNDEGELTRGTTPHLSLVQLRALEDIGYSNDILAYYKEKAEMIRAWKQGIEENPDNEIVYSFPEFVEEEVDSEDETELAQGESGHTDEENNDCELARPEL